MNYLFSVFFILLIDYKSIIGNRFLMFNNFKINLSICLIVYINFIIDFFFLECSEKDMYSLFYIYKS